MAGSYGHVVDDDFKFLEDGEAFRSQIENLGDAYEACRMCVAMIDYLASTPRKGKGRRRRIREAIEAYYEDRDGGKERD